MLTQPALFARVHRFWFLPSAEMHPSWYAEFYPAPVARLLEAGRFADDAGHRWLSQRVLDRLPPPAGRGLGEGRAAAVFLLERDRLWRLVRHAAAALVGPHARRALSGPAVSAWREALGLELHGWALERAPLLVPAALSSLPYFTTGSTLPPDLSPGERRERRVRSGAPPGTERPMDEASLPREPVTAPALRVEQATAAAVSLLQRTIAACPGVWERLRLKLPRQAGVAADAPSVDDWPVAAERLLHRILREIEPRWYSSFANPAA